MKKIDYANYKTPSDYMKFDQGENTIRIISSGGLTKRHGTRMGQRYVPLGECTENPDCKFCLQGNEPKLKWTWIVFDYATEEAKILDAGKMIGDAICQISKKQGNPEEYDLIIKKSGEMLKTQYEVRMGKKSKFSDESKDKVSLVKKYLIKKYF